MSHPRALLDWLILYTCILYVQDNNSKNSNNNDNNDNNNNNNKIAAIALPPLTAHHNYKTHNNMISDPGLKKPALPNSDI